MTAVKESEREKCEAAALLNKDGGEEARPDPYAPPDGGWGWIVMVASFLCCLVLDGIAYVFGVFMGPMQEYYEVDYATMAGVGSVLSGTIQLVGPFVALLTNLLGTRIVCIIGAAVSSAGFFLATYSPNVLVLLLLFGVVAGTGLGLMYVPAVVVVGHYFDKRRALATGFAVCGSGAGTFVLAPLASFLLTKLEWQGAVRVFAALCLACVFCGLTMKPLPTRPKQREIVADGEAAEVTEKAPNCLMTVLESSCSPRLLRNIPFMLLCLSNLFATQGLYIPYSFIPVLAKERLCNASVNTTLLEGSASGEEGEDPCAEAAVAAAFLISIVGICNTLCRILSGYVTDLPGVNSLVVTTLALGLGGIAPLAMPFCYSYASFVVVCVMFGSFLSAWCAVTSPAIVDICGIDLLTSGFGSLTFVRGFAALVGQFLYNVPFLLFTTFSPQVPR